MILTRNLGLVIAKIADLVNPLNGFSSEHVTNHPKYNQIGEHKKGKKGLKFKSSRPPNMM